MKIERVNFCPLFMAAMRSRCGHYIFVLWFLVLLVLLLVLLVLVLFLFLLLSFFLSFFTSPNLSRRTLDVYHTSTHGVALVRI